MVYSVYTPRPAAHHTFRPRIFSPSPAYVFVAAAAAALNDVAVLVHLLARVRECRGVH